MDSPVPPCPNESPPSPGPGWCVNVPGRGELAAKFQSHSTDSQKGTLGPLGDLQTENSSSCSYGGGEGEVTQKRETNKQTIQNCLRTPQYFPQVDTQANAQRHPDPGSVQMYYTRNKEAGVGYPA